MTSGLLPGPTQTVLRAELKAVLEALTFAWRFQKPFSLWVDNQQVVDKYFFKIQEHPDRTWTRKIKNHDLVSCIANLMHQCRFLVQRISQVYSHQGQAGASDAVDEWCFRGSSEADRIANEAFANRLFQFWLVGDQRGVPQIGHLSLRKLQLLSLHHRPHMCQPRHQLQRNLGPLTRIRNVIISYPAMTRTLLGMLHSM